MIPDRLPPHVVPIATRRSHATTGKRHDAGSMRHSVVGNVTRHEDAGGNVLAQASISIKTNKTRKTPKVMTLPVVDTALIDR